jgi:hypothetical protein
VMLKSRGCLSAANWRYCCPCRAQKTEVVAIVVAGRNFEEMMSFANNDDFESSLMIQWVPTVGPSVNDRFDRNHTVTRPYVLVRGRVLNPRQRLARVWGAIKEYLRGKIIDGKETCCVLLVRWQNGERRAEWEASRACGRGHVMPPQHSWVCKDESITVMPPGYWRDNKYHPLDRCVYASVHYCRLLELH